MLQPPAGNQRKRVSVAFVFVRQPIEIISQNAPNRGACRTSAGKDIENVGPMCRTRACSIAVWPTDFVVTSTRSTRRRMRAAAEAKTNANSEASCSSSLVVTRTVRF